MYEGKCVCVSLLALIVRLKRQEPFAVFSVLQMPKYVDSFILCMAEWQSQEFMEQAHLSLVTDTNTILGINNVCRHQLLAQ